jgi:rhamnosyltransferase
MVSKLVEASILLQQKNKNIAAVGPVYVNSITGTHSYFVRFNVFGLNRIYCSDKNTTNYILSDFLISSGCLISLDIFKYIGMMDERLFIDHVDTEWFVRAKSKDYSSYGVCDAFMEHNIGEKTIRLWFHRKKEIGKHNPVRLYYNIRNSLLLLRYNYCTLKICFVLIKRTLTLSLFYILFVSPRTEYIKYVYRAIKDAFLEKSGKIELT